MTDSRPLRVLVVDDSAVVRQTMTSILSNEGFEVTTAADAFIAEDRLDAANPDVMVLDLEMPGMDGLSVLRKIMSERPMPVVICSAVAARGTEKALRALEDGAVEIVAKPRHAVRDFLYESSVMLSDTIRAAAAARLSQPKTTRRMARPVPSTEAVIIPSSEPSSTVIAMGASTGGTDALRTILSGLDATSPGVVIVQHMPANFTAAFARSLAASSRMDVREAANGNVIGVGTALVAPGDRHMRVARSGGRYVVRLADGPLVSRHRPSVDVLFRSVAESAGSNAVGVILTGMGADGAEGLLAMRNAGAYTIAQDEATSIVFGMPKEAIRLGGAEAVLPLAEVACGIRSMGRSRSPLARTV